MVAAAVNKRALWGVLACGLCLLDRDSAHIARFLAEISPHRAAYDAAAGAA
jgi:hypothetical protein